VLRSGVVLFDPHLPSKKGEAIRNLAMGDVTKVMLTFADKVIPAFSYITTNGLVRLWWKTKRERNTVLTGYAGGKYQATMLAERGSDAAHQGIRELSQMFGGELAGACEDAFVINWAHQPWIAGAYSYTPVGALGSRAILAEPIDGRIFFMGEATSTAGHVGTVHGAIETSQRAVTDLQKSLTA